MISTLLSFLIGFSIFIINSRLKTQWTFSRLTIFLFIGTATGAIIGAATVSPMYPLMNIPWPGFAIAGFLTGCLLFAAYHWSLFTKPVIRYFTTIILGLALAGTLYLLTILFRLRITPLQFSRNQEISLIFNLILIGFLSIFGFSFPTRRFRPQKSDSRDHAKDE